MNFKHLLIPILAILSFQLWAQNSTKGNWAGPFPTDIVATAAANLPNGNILMWSSESKLTFTGTEGKTYTSIFNPSNNTFATTLVTNTGHDMFCPGTSNLPDGRILVTGGSNSNKSSIYNPITNQWSIADEMNTPRGYHSHVTLNSGASFTLGGSWSGGLGGKTAEVWTPETGWIARPGINADATVRDGAPDPAGVYRDDNHAWFFAAPNGKVFHAGPANKMHWMETAGLGRVTSAGTRGDDAYAMNGIAVMYDKGKILKSGGAPSYDTELPASKRCYVIDISDPNSDNVTVTRVADMNFARTLHHMVPLPNGEVMAFGGLPTSKLFSDLNAILPAEIWNPNTGQWRIVDAAQVPRTYHSTGILMPDGRVFAGGGGLCGGCAANHPDVELYSPPYLYNSNSTLASRPVINSAPSTANYSQNISVSMNSSVTSFSLIRFGSDTHSVNNEQRRVPVTATNAGGNNYSVKMPERKYAPPGYYMLFAMNAAGTPSVSKVIKIGTAIPGDQTSLDIIANDSFDDLNSGIIGARGGNGWNGPWQRINSSGTFGNRNNPLSYGDLTVGGYAMKIDPVSNVGMVGERFLETPVNSGTVWFSYLVSADKLGVGHAFLSPTASLDGAIGKKWGDQFASNNNATSKKFNQTNKTYLLVAKYVLNPNGSDQMYMWVDPSLSSEPSVANADLSKTINLSSIDRVRINFQGWGQGTYYVDEIRLGRTWPSILQSVGSSSATSSCSSTAKESFIYSQSTGINSAGGGLGFSNNWSIESGGNKVAFQNGSLSFAGVPTSGNKVRFNMNNTGSSSIRRNFDTNFANDDEMWVSMLIGINDLKTGGVWLRPNGRQDIAIGKRWVNVFGIDNNSGSNLAPQNGQTYRLVARYKFNGSNTKIDLWVNPSAGNFNINSPWATKTVGAVSNISYVTLKAENGSGEYTVDELYFDCAPPVDLATGGCANANESFNYVNGSSVNSAGGGSGFSSNWNVERGGNKTSFQNGSLSFSGVPSAGNKIRFDLNNTDGTIVRRNFSQNLADENTMWISMLIRPNDLKTGGVWIRPNGRQDIAIGKRWGSYFGIDNNSGSGINLQNGTTYRLVARYQFNASNTEIKLWINPTSGNFNINNPWATKTVGAISNIDHVVLRAEKGSGDYNLDALYFGCTAPSDLGTNIRSSEFANDLQVNHLPGRKAGLRWEVNQERAVKEYIVQHATENNGQFIDLKQVAPYQSNVITAYEYEHIDPAIGQLNYYRIKIEFTDGSTEFTPHRKIFFDVILGPIPIFPNPVVDELFIDLSNYMETKIEYFISDDKGAVLYSNTFEENHLKRERIDLSQMKNGNYFIYMKPDNRKAITQQFIILKTY